MSLGLLMFRRIQQVVKLTLAGKGVNAVTEEPRAGTQRVWAGSGPAGGIWVEGR